MRRRELLLGVFGCGAANAGLYPSIDKAVEAVAHAIPVDGLEKRNWFPVIDAHHAQAAIAYAGRARKIGGLTTEEYDWVCDKARRAILNDSRDKWRGLIDATNVK
jgi:hypothetical protein